MAKVDFPNSPSDGDTVVVSGSTFIYSSAKSNWSAVSNVSRIGVSDLTVGSDLSASGSGDLTYSTATGAPVLTYTPPVVPSQHSTTVYATAGDLPLAGNVTGNQAFVTSTNRLYLWDGAGWYNIALVNVSPTITTGSDATYTLATDGTATVITLAATDPDGEDITWGYAVTVGALGSTATVSQADNEFTITPSTTDGGTFSLTFTASNEINTDTSTSAFALVFVVPWAGTLERRIANPSPFTGDQWGISSAVAITDTYVAVGEPGREGHRGVDLFNVSDGTLAYRIEAPHADEVFANKIEMSGNWLAVHSVNDTARPNDKNCVFVYDISTFSSSTITTANYQILDSSTANGGHTNANDFGKLAMAIDGNNLVIGAKGATNNSGEAFIYDMSTFSSSTISATGYTYKLTNPNSHANATADNFGCSVAINGNKVVIGSQESSATATYSGAVYYYDMSTFSSSAITASNMTIANPNISGLEASDMFSDEGRLAITSDRIIAGGRHGSGNYVGVVYIFNHSGTLLHTLTTPDSGLGFGTAYAVDGNRLFVTQVNWSAHSNSRIYYYDLGSLSGSVITTAGTAIQNPDSNGQSEHFYYKVSAANGKIAVGAHLDDTGGTNAGTVYVFTA